MKKFLILIMYHKFEYEFSKKKIFLFYLLFRKLTELCICNATY